MNTRFSKYKPTAFLFVYIRLCCLAVKRFSSKQQFLCCGDSAGAVILLEIPSCLKDPKPGELRAMHAYIEREEQHHLYVQEKRFSRPVKTGQWGDNAAMNEQLANLFKSDEAAEGQQKIQEEFQEYLEMEYELQHKLGIYKFADEDNSRSDRGTKCGQQEKSFEDGGHSRGAETTGGSQVGANSTTTSYVTSASKVASDLYSYSSDEEKHE
ncbi:uncharacterized protein LOC134841217 [Symsagittifera roscoffensis]|uniref:uncharacterized protein LOC134841217 n=1 Tax=Symsagittifera roscoffensis TaxID=84072 RepID=UPI00307B8DAF